MSNKEENLTNPVVKNIIDDVTNEAVGVALLHNIPDQKHYGYRQSNFDIIETYENKQEGMVTYSKVPVKTKNSLYTVSSESFEGGTKDSKKSDKMHDQDLADFKVFKLKTLGALYNDRAKDYPEETYESEVFPQAEYFQKQNPFSAQSEKNISSPASIYNFNNKEDDIVNINYSKPLSTEESKYLDSELDVPNINMSTYCYCECLNIKKHGDGDTNIPVETSLTVPALLAEGTVNLPSDILPPVSDNDNCPLEYNKLVNKELQLCVLEEPTSIDQPFLSKIDRITLDNVQMSLNQKSSNDSIEDNNCVPIYKRTDDFHFLNLPEVVSPLNYRSDKSSEWINKESDILFKETNTLSEDDPKKPFSSFYNMSPSPRFINYLYTSDKSYSDNKNVNTGENETLYSHQDKSNQSETENNDLEMCNNNGEIYSFEEDRNKTSSVSLKETNPFFDNDTIVHINTAEYDKSTQTFKRYYETFTDNNTDINSPTKSSLLEMCKLGYTFDDNEKSTELPDLPNISPNTLENWEEGHEVEVNIIEPVSPEDTDEPTRKTLKRPRTMSNDSPLTYRKKVWSAVGLVDKPRAGNTLFHRSDNESETESSIENILDKKNSLEIDIFPAMKNSLCKKSSSEFDQNNLSKNSLEVQESQSKVHSPKMKETINEHSDSSEYSPHINEINLHSCFSRTNVSVHYFEGSPESNELKSNDSNMTNSSFISSTTVESRELTDSKNNTLTKSSVKKGFFAWLINLFRRNKTKTIKEEKDDKKLEIQKKRNSLEKGKIK